MAAFLTWMKWYVSCACADGSRALNYPASIKPLQRRSIWSEKEKSYGNARYACAIRPFYNTCISF
jgi:hypothetical protein